MYPWRDVESQRSPQRPSDDIDIADACKGIDKIDNYACITIPYLQIRIDMKKVPGINIVRPGVLYYSRSICYG
jgi:hypothetical protein